MLIRRLLQVSLTVAALTYSCAGAFAASNPVPLIYQPLSPGATAPGGPAFTLTVNGTGFVSGAVVNWNGSARTTTFVSSSQITAQITATDIATAGTVVVTATNPGPGGGTSNGQYFQITNPLTPTNFTVFTNHEIDIARIRQANILLADFNGDGKLDVVGYANATIYFLKGDGDGSFSGGWVASVGPPVSPASNPDDTSLATADLNGDGKPDLVLSNNNGIFVALGNGDGTFKLLSGPLNAPLARQIPIIGDFNGDGFLDLAYATASFNLQVLSGNGDGTFRTGSSIAGVPGQDFNSVLATGDFHGGGKLDLLVSMVNLQGCIASSFSLVEYPGNGDGTFGTPSTIPGYSSCGGSPTVAVADFNGDGKLDFAFYSQPEFGQLFSVSLGNGDGTFQVPYQVVAPNSSPLLIGPLLTGDLNGDGKLDLVTGLQVFYGNGDGTFTTVGAPSSNPLPNNSNAFAQVGDLNGDGKLDLLGDGGGFSDIQTFIQVPAPADFGGAISPTTQTVIPGNSVNYSGTVTALNGFTGTVSLSASGMPAGVTALFGPATITGGSGSYTLTLSAASSVPLGNYTITVTGTSGAVSHSSSVTLVVNSSLGDFAVSIAPSSDAFLNLNCGQSGAYVFQVTPINGYTGDVTFSIEAAGPLAPPNTATFNPVTVHGASGTTTLTVNTVANCFNSTSGSLILSATSGPIVHQGDVFLGISHVTGDFTGSTTPSSQTIQVGQSAS